MNQNNLNFREIIELFDSSDSPIYFIPIYVRILLMKIMTVMVNGLKMI